MTSCGTIEVPVRATLQWNTQDNVRPANVIEFETMLSCTFDESDCTQTSAWSIEEGSNFNQGKLRKLPVGASATLRVTAICLQSNNTNLPCFQGQSNPFTVNESQEPITITMTSIGTL